MHPDSSSPLANGLRETTSEDRPQERLERLGPAALSDAELVAMLLRSGSAQCDVLTLARRLMREAGSLGALLRWSVEDFQQLPGIGKVKALQWITVIEIARRILTQQTDIDLVMDSPERVYKHLAPISIGLAIEKCWVLCLDSRRRLIRRREITSGLANKSLIHPREVFREAVRTEAVSVVVAHNHPSGDPTPSQADFQSTNFLSKAAKTIDISFDDHVILGTPGNPNHPQGFFSFSENGFLS